MFLEKSHFSCYDNLVVKARNKPNIVRIIMIKTIFQNKRPTLSFEVFPPKKEGEFTTVYDTLDTLSRLNPDFISVTYGAGGSKSKQTVEIASYIANQLHIESLAHLTCVGFTSDDLFEVCDTLKNSGIINVLALRGDRPQSMSDQQFNNREFLYASEMISFLKKYTSFDIGAACYPEKHYEADSKDSDLFHLKEKVTNGADFLISQLFFNNQCFYDLKEQASSVGIHVPICAGIMPITSSKQLGTTISLSGSSVPKKLADLIANYGDNAYDMRKAGIEFAISQILDLIKHDVDGIHIYTMNKPDIASEIVAGISSYL